MRRLGPRAFLSTCVAASVLGAAFAAAPSTAAPPSGRTYSNPLAPKLPNGRTVDSCADPTVLRGQRADDPFWYLYCTTDPFNDQDVDAQGELRFRPIPQMRSRDLVHWKFVSNALPPVKAPDWAAEGAGLWAPDVVYSRATDRYYLSFVVTDTDDSLRGPTACASTGDSAIGVAVSKSPTGPWRVSDQPLVEPRPDPEAPPADCKFFWTYDPDVLGNNVGRNSTLYYGSYYGGIQARSVHFTRRGATTSGPGTQITSANRYEGTNVVKRKGWYYLFASATNCCAGPLTSYGVFAGRSRTPMGVFRDPDGNTLLEPRVGGAPVLLPNGNRWIGTGHNSVVRDAAGRWWTVYHAVDRADPYFATDPVFTKRPVLLDPLDWVKGWPKVRAGRGPSNKSMPAPAVRANRPSAYRPSPIPRLTLGRELPGFSDDFSSGELEAAWRWTGTAPAATTFGVEDGALRWDTQKGDIARDSNDAAVLSHRAPRRGDFVVQTRVQLNLPNDKSLHNYVQAGLVLHDGVDKFIKLVHVSIWDTRQTEFAKEVPVARGTPNDPDEVLPVYGNGVVGPPGETTALRIVVDRRRGPDRYTAYTKQNGGSWVRGGTWTHTMASPRIGLVSMGDVAEEGFTARFLDVRTWRLGR